MSTSIGALKTQTVSESVNKATKQDVTQTFSAPAPTEKVSISPEARARQSTELDAVASRGIDSNQRMTYQVSAQAKHLAALQSEKSPSHQAVMPVVGPQQG